MHFYKSIREESQRGVSWLPGSYRVEETQFIVTKIYMYLVKFQRIWAWLTFHLRTQTDTIRMLRSHIDSGSSTFPWGRFEPSNFTTTSTYQPWPHIHDNTSDSYSAASKSSQETAGVAHEGLSPSTHYFRTWLLFHWNVTGTYYYLSLSSRCIIFKGRGDVSSYTLAYLWFLVCVDRQIHNFSSLPTLCTLKH